MAVPPVNIFIILRDVKQCLLTYVSYIVSLFWVLTFSLSTRPPNETNFIASNVVYYVDVDDNQKHVDGMLVNLVQWFVPLLIWLIFYFWNTMKNNVDMTTVSKTSMSRLQKSNEEEDYVDLYQQLRQSGKKPKKQQQHVIQYLLFLLPLLTFSCHTLRTLLTVAKLLLFRFALIVKKKNLVVARNSRGVTSNTRTSLSTMVSLLCFICIATVKGQETTSCGAHY